MAPPRPQAVTEPPLPIPPQMDNVPYTLALLGEYTHTLDSLPIDLSRNFADLRELDAVLSSSVLSITAKIQQLTTMIEEGRVSKTERLWLLNDIAEEAQRLKLGGEDKIRVACQGADTLRSHTAHMRALAMHIPGFDPAPLDRTTVYPHVSERAYMPPVAEQTGRRRRGVLGSIMTNPDPHPSPAKRKRVPKDDDVDVGPSRTPKRAGGESNARARTNARAKKTDRALSPSDSLVSVTSHLPPAVARNNSASNRAGGATNKRSRAAGGASSHRNPTPLANEAFPANDAGHHGHTNGHSTSSRNRGAAAADYNGVPPSASHPSLPQPYGNGAGVSGSGYDGVHAGDWNSIPRASQLEGPGMPVARSASVHSTATSMPAAASAAAAAAAGAMDTTDGGEGDGDGDDRTYCFCDNVSYGQMVGCDGPHCEREWFHLACVGLTVVPEGNWFCEPCKTRKTTKRTARGTKRRAGVGSRAGGR